MAYSFRLLTADQTSHAAEQARFVREKIPAGGLFFGHEWRIAPAPFVLEPGLAQQLEKLGRVLLQFNRAVNLLYRKSVEGRQPEWIASWLDQGKPAELIQWQRSPTFKNEMPRVIRPDILLTDSGFSITELDSVPGGIGLTAWLNQTYSALGGTGDPPVPSGDPPLGTGERNKYSSGLEKKNAPSIPSGQWPDGTGGSPVLPISQNVKSSLIGGADGMLNGFAGIFGDAKNVHIVVSEEAATYRPEMEWIGGQIQGSRFKVQSSKFSDFADGDAVYRFFELFDLANVPSAQKIFQLAQEKKIRLTPSPKPIFEEKLLFALLWNRNLNDFWRQELGESFFAQMKSHVPYTWLVDPAPLPPHGAIPELNLTDWQQLKTLSQKERDLILKISGYSEKAWGSRGVYLGSDLSTADWSAAVDEALCSFSKSPFILQRYQKPKLVRSSWFDFEKCEVVFMEGRARLCPYYFVSGEGDAARAQLGGVLATICPADKKIIHGMRDAILAPCSA